MTLSFRLNHIHYATCKPSDALIVIDHQRNEYHKCYALHAYRYPVYYSTIVGLSNLTEEFKYYGEVKYHDDIF